MNEVNGNNAINTVENEMNDRQIEAITTGLGFAVKCWLSSVDNPYKVMEQLKALEEKVDTETRDALQGIVGMIQSFGKVYEQAG